MSSLTTYMNTLKDEEGLIKKINQYLITKDDHVVDGDRKNDTNSPSSALGCNRANFYQREGITKDVTEPRLQRIFDNGDGVHERIQNYLYKCGFLFMDEVPLYNAEYDIQGHTDGIGSLSGKKNRAEIVEIKSINDNGFRGLKKAKEEHEAQAQVYIFCAEQQRLKLKNDYPTKRKFDRSIFKRRKFYRSLYTHLVDGKKFTKEEKINHKVELHLKMDEILYGIEFPITKAIILYENKNTQEMKEFIIEMNDELQERVLEGFELNNYYWEQQELPPRTCKNKSDGRWCAYVDKCFNV